MADDDVPEASRRVDRSGGSTPSERKLAELADKTFLDLWSYSNLYNDKKQHAKGDGQELCDLLVVCGDDVLVFSDKSGGWPQLPDVKIAWVRWCRKNIEKSVAQVNGAVRWLREFPSRVFLDKACATPLPISLPPSDRARYHGIVIATGASGAIQRQFNDESRTFFVIPALKGQAHYDPAAPDFCPMAFGDLNPGKTFVHVFNGEAIDRILGELNTVTDFVEYLIKREALIRSEVLIVAPGEEDLLAHYMQTIDKHGRHDFLGSHARKVKKGFRIGLAGGDWDHYHARPEYFAKREADRVSYVWDRLIQVFTKEVLAGTQVTILETPPSVRLAEQALRIMALEPRVNRRLLGASIQQAIKAAQQPGHDRYARVMLPGPNAATPTAAYVVMLLAFLPEQMDNSYHRYREMRGIFLQLYCDAVLADYPAIQMVVGIGLDLKTLTSARGGSEDLIAVARHEQSEDERAKLRKAREEFQILTKGSLRVTATAYEFPAPEESVPRFDEFGAPLSRQRRRALERAARKAARPKRP